LNNTESKNLKRGAFYFIILLGLVSLLADVTYEGARSVTGPYLGLLGASSAVVGFAAALVKCLVTLSAWSQAIGQIEPTVTGS